MVKLHKEQFGRSPTTARSSDPAPGVVFEIFGFEPEDTHRDGSSPA
jgi:hypothetical protein